MFIDKIAQRRGFAGDERYTSAFDVTKIDHRTRHVISITECESSGMIVSVGTLILHCNFSSLTGFNEVVNALKTVTRPFLL